MTGDEIRVAGLLLAAGGSTRLGKPKQLVELRGETLIRRASTALIDAGCDPVVVVIGSDAEKMREELDGLAVIIAENPVWSTGLSSSIRSGIDSVLAIEPLLDAVLITLVDQPRVASLHLRALIEQFSASSAPIVAAEYGGVQGVPALFDATYFSKLKNLAGDQGARSLIRNEPKLVSIPVPEARVDVDTPSDLDGLR